MSPLFDLPPTYEATLEKRLQALGHSLEKPEKLAGEIRKLSNLFLKGIESANYWVSPDFRAAYISYFAVLNFVRARSVFREAQSRQFLNHTKTVVDWGCGVGSATWAMLAEWSDATPPIIHGADQSTEALDEYKSWARFFNVKSETHKVALSKIDSVRADTVILSYVLNEVSVWPKIPEHVKRLVIIEPSTHQAGRELSQWRDERLASGWNAWAPCTHQKKCPLILHSGKDWCHHRIHWNKPGWFFELEKYLPMKNDTLTLSYLLISRDPMPGDLVDLARVVGDEQEERGKSRQLICRGDQREFLSWLHRDQFSLKLKRGDILRLSENLELRSNELRVIDPQSVVKK